MWNGVGAPPSTVFALRLLGPFHGGSVKDRDRERENEKENQRRTQIKKICSYFKRFYIYLNSGFFWFMIAMCVFLVSFWFHVVYYFFLSLSLSPVISSYVKHFFTFHRSHMITDYPGWFMFLCCLKFCILCYISKF